MNWSGRKGKGGKKSFPDFFGHTKKIPPYKSRDQKCLLLLPKTKSSLKRSKKIFFAIFILSRVNGKSVVAHNFVQYVLLFPRSLPRVFVSVGQAISRRRIPFHFSRISFSFISGKIGCVAAHV